jgi:hypothetical protein
MTDQPQTTQKRTSFVQGITSLITLIIIGYIAYQWFSSSPSEPKINNLPSAQELSKLTPEEQIKKLVSSVVTGTVGTDKKEALRDTRVTNSNNDFLVSVDFNASSGLSDNLYRLGMEKKMTNIYKTLYNSSINIKSVQVTGFDVLIDSFGNEEDGRVYQTRLDKAEGEKVNWDQDDATLSNQVLPNIWKIVFILPDIRPDVFSE